MGQKCQKPKGKKQKKIVFTLGVDSYKGKLSIARVSLINYYRSLDTFY